MPGQSEDLPHLNRLFFSETRARALFTKIRWSGGEYCPHCGHTKLYHFNDGKTYKCASCQRSFSIVVGTIFEGTKLYLSNWLEAIWCLCNEPGVTSTVLARRLNVSQKTAWYMLDLLRRAALTPFFKRYVEAADAKVGRASSSLKRLIKNQLPLVRSPMDESETLAVETALRALSQSINLGSGLDHPGDELRARHFINKLLQAGRWLNPAGIKQWALCHAWDKHSARQLENVVREEARKFRNRP